MPINQRQPLHTKNSVILFLAHTVVTIFVDIQLSDSDDRAEK